MKEDKRNLKTDEVMNRNLDLMVLDNIEIFEDFLAEKGIVIENPEKEGDPNASNIYGTDYGKLENKLIELYEDIVKSVVKYMIMLLEKELESNEQSV